MVLEFTEHRNEGNHSDDVVVNDIKLQRMCLEEDV